MIAHDIVRLAAPRGVRIATYALALVCALSPLAARAADQGDGTWIAWAVLVGVALLVAGILIRAATGIGDAARAGSRSSRAVARKAGRRRWREWPDD